MYMYMYMYINTHVNELRYIVNGDKPFTMYSTYMYSVASMYIIYMVHKIVSLLYRGVLYVEAVRNVIGTLGAVREMEVAILYVCDMLLWRKTLSLSSFTPSFSLSHRLCSEALEYKDSHLCCHIWRCGWSQR